MPAATKRLLLFPVICLIAFGPVHAQVFDMGGLTATLSIDHVTQSERARSEPVRGTDIAAQVTSSLGEGRSTAHSPADAAFTSSDRRRSANLARFAERMRAADPVGAEQMVQLFAAADVIRMIGQGIAPYGLKTDNVADAYAVYWMTAWQAANGDTSDFTKPQCQAVRQQAANALLSTPAFIASDDAAKQEIAEAYLIQAALIQASMDAAQTNPAIAEGLPMAVQRGAAASGLDLSAMRLTGSGFELR